LLRRSRSRWLHRWRGRKNNLFDSPAPSVHQRLISVAASPRCVPSCVSCAPSPISACVNWRRWGVVAAGTNHDSRRHTRTSATESILGHTRELP